VVKRFKFEGKFYKYRDVVELPYIKARPLLRSGKMVKITDQKGAKELLPKKVKVKEEATENIAEVVLRKKPPKHRKSGVNANVER
jgi:hypothetical protein